MTINKHTLWHPSNILLVFTGSAVRVWVLGAVGDYIHPAAGSPRGKGGNVIYTLIMPAPLNTPPDRSNVLDISSSFLLPLSPSFLSFCLDSPYIPNPMLIFALLAMNTEQWSCRGAAVICVREHVHVCVQNVHNRRTTLTLPLLLSLFLLPSPQSSPIKTYPLSISFHYSFV